MNSRITRLEKIQDQFTNIGYEFSDFMLKVAKTGNLSDEDKEEESVIAMCQRIDTTLTNIANIDMPKHNNTKAQEKLDKFIAKR